MNAEPLGDAEYATGILAMHAAYQPVRNEQLVNISNKNMRPNGNGGKRCSKWCSMRRARGGENGR